MEKSEEELIESRIMLKVNNMFHEQDKRIIKILDNQEIIQEEHKELMAFMKQQQTKGNGYIEKFIWLILGALVTLGASFLKK